MKEEVITSTRHDTSIQNGINQADHSSGIPTGMVTNWTAGKVDSNKSIKALEVVPTEFDPAAIKHSIFSMMGELIYFG
jgi:hypothetical protein